MAKRVLAAARRGHLELEPEEEYLVEKKEAKKVKTTKKAELDVRLATKVGYLSCFVIKVWITGILASRAGSRGKAGGFDEEESEVYQVHG